MLNLDFFTKFEILDLSIDLFIFIFASSVFTRKFIVIRSVKHFVSMSDILALLNKLQTSGILFSSSPFCVLRTAVVTKPLVSGILFSTLPISVS